MYMLLKKFQIDIFCFVSRSKNGKVGLQSDSNQVKNSYAKKCCNHSMFNVAQVNTKYSYFVFFVLRKPRVIKTFSWITFLTCMEESYFRNRLIKIELFMLSFILRLTKNDSMEYYEYFIIGYFMKEEEQLHVHVY